VADAAPKPGPRIGVLGGTFDPVHLGHVASACETADVFALERVLLVLSARPPHKGQVARAPIRDRLAMLELAADRDPRLQVSTVEVDRNGPSYTVDTLLSTRENYPEHELFLILGNDAYCDVDSWSRPERLLELANLVVTSRPGQATPPACPAPPVAARASCCYDPAIDGYVHPSGHKLVFQPIKGIRASSSEIRDLLERGLEIEQLTGAEVARYILKHGLYGVNRT